MKTGTFRKYDNYIIYSDGRIWSKRNKKFLTHKMTWDGYARTQIWDGHSNYKNFFFHKVIAETFIPNPENKPHVNHLDGNRLNNDISNLEWCTQSENIQHAWRMGFCKRQLNSVNSVPVDQFTKTGEFIKTYPSQMEAERQTKIFHTGISAVCRGKSHTAGGYVWRFHETCND